MIYSTKRTWQSWEAGINTMHPALWEHFKLKLSDDARMRALKRD